jgi:hypothetical protein
MRSIKSDVMKTFALNLKKFLHENKEDLQYLLYAGLPAGILSALLSCFFNFSKVF